MKEKIIIGLFLLFYTLYIIFVSILAYTYELEYPKGMGMFIMSVKCSFIFGTTTMILAIIILIKSRQTKDKKIRAFGILCRYVLIAPLISAILLYVANNVANREPFHNFLDRDFLNKFSLISFITINVIGIINTVLLYLIGNRMASKTQTKKAR